MTKNHPYKEYEKQAIWKALRKAIKVLAANGDLELRTSEQYVIGYLAKSLNGAGVVAEAPAALPISAAVRSGRKMAAKLDVPVAKVPAKPRGSAAKATSRK